MENFSSIVDVVIITYNQENYIAQCIESALNQIVDFKLRIILGDDSSTDTTSDLCLSYFNKHPEIIFYYRNNDNLGLIKNYKKAFLLCKSKYIAILEGDDFWHDRFKLQKQVEILETNPNIGLVYTDLNHLFEDGTLIENVNRVKKRNTPDGKVFKKIIRKNTISSLTTCFRYSLLLDHVDFDKFIAQEYVTLDLPLWLSITPYTKVKYLKDSTATYRIHGSSISNTSNPKKQLYFIRSSFSIKKQFAEKHNLNYRFALDELHKNLMIHALINDLDRELAMLRKIISLFNLKNLILFFASTNILKQITKKFFKDRYKKYE